MLWESVCLFVVTCAVLSAAMLKAVADEYRVGVGPKRVRFVAAKQRMGHAF